MLLKERKLGDPRTESGCKETDRSTVIGDKGTVATDAVDGRRAIRVPKPNPSGTRRQAGRRANVRYVIGWRCCCVTARRSDDGGM